MFTRNFGRAIVGSWSDISSTSSIRAPSPVSPLVPPPSRIDLSQRSIAPGNLDPSSKYLPDPLRYTRFLEIPFFFSLSFFFFPFFLFVDVVTRRKIKSTRMKRNRVFDRCVDNASRTYVSDRLLLSIPIQR